MAKEIVISITEDGMTVYISPDFGDDVPEITVVQRDDDDIGESEFNNRQATLTISTPSNLIVMGNDAEIADAETIVDGLVGVFQAEQPEGEVITIEDFGMLIEHMNPPIHVFKNDEVYIVKTVVDDGTKTGSKPLTGWFKVTDYDYNSVPMRLFVALPDERIVLLNSALVRKVRP